MKYIFLISFLVLLGLSVVAVQWKPRQVDPRVEGLDFCFERISSGSVSFEDAFLFFQACDINGSGGLDREDGENDARVAQIVEFLLLHTDDDGDGHVSIEEWKAFLEYLDGNQDGVLSKEDYPGYPQIPIIWCSDDNPVRREQIRLFNRKHPQYRVILDPQNAGMEKVIVQSLAGVGPDVFDCYTGYQLSTYVRAGIALELGSYFEESGLDIEEFWPSLKPLLFHEGKVYGALNNAGTQAVWYNKKIFDEAGIPYPQPDWTWDECLDICRRLTIRNERGQITRYGIIGFWDWKLALFQFGANIFNTEGTRCILDSPEAIAAVQFMQDLVYKYEVMPTPQAELAMASAGGWGSGVITLFAAERSAMAIGGRWWLCILREPSYSHLKLGAVEIPILVKPNGEKSRRIYGYGRSTLVNATSKNREGALAFVKFLFSEDWSALINRQADALGPVRRFSYTEEFMFNPKYPEEDYNTVWRSAMENADAEIISPYVSGQVVERILVKQMDLVRSNQKNGEQAMRDATRLINKAIIETLEKDRTLREQYYRALAQGAQPAWEPGTVLRWEEKD